MNNGDAVLSIVIPARNESEGLPHVLQQLADTLRRLPVSSEVLVVDDASTDRTGEVAAAMGALVLRNPVNLGYGHSILRGVASVRGQIIGICDADGTYDVTQIPDLYACIEDGIDHAISERTGSAFRQPRLRRFMYRSLCTYVVGARVPDANSGLRLFRREMVEQLRGDLCLGFSFTTSLTIASLMSGYVVGFYPAAYCSRRAGQSHVRFRDMLRTAQYLFQLIACYNPVKLFLPLVVMSLLATVLAGTMAAFRGADWGTAALFAASTMVLTGFMAHAYVVARAAAGPIRGAVRRANGASVERYGARQGNHRCGPLPSQGDAL